MCLTSTILSQCRSADATRQSPEKIVGAPSVFRVSVSGELRQLSGGPKGEGKRGIEVKQDKKMKGSATNLHQPSNCAGRRLLTRSPRNIGQLCIYFPVKHTITLNRKVLKSIKKFVS